MNNQETSLWVLMEGLESKSGEQTEEEIEKVGAGDQGIMFGFACE